MQTLSSQDAFQLSKSFRDISVWLGNYRFAKWDQMSEEQRRAIEDAEWSLLNASADIRTVAIGLVLDETHLSYEALQEVTSDAKRTLEQLAAIRKAITIATAAVSLAGAIVSRDSGAIVNSARGLYDAMREA